MMKRLALCLIVGIAGLTSPLHAQEVTPIAPAWGTLRATIACDFDPNSGLIVSMAAFQDPQPSGFQAQLGDRCLEVLKQIPAAFIKPPVWAHLSGFGAAVEAPNGLVWVVGTGNTINAIVGCAVETGLLVTKFVDPPTRYTPTPVESCLTTLAALEAMSGGTAMGPTAADLSINGNGIGTLLFARSRGFGFIEMANDDAAVVEVVGCGRNNAGALVVKYHERSDTGIMPVAPDQSCAITVTGFGTFSVKHREPVAVGKPREFTDPGCLIWIIEGGTIF